MGKTVCIRMDKDLYDNIVGVLPDYQGDSNIYNWLPTQYTDTVDHIANPPHEIIYSRMYSLNQPAGSLPLIPFTVNMFTNRIF